MKLKMKKQLKQLKKLIKWNEITYSLSIGFFVLSIVTLSV